MSYGAAKAALENYAMSAAAELAPYGITANIVHPPVTDTGWVTDDVRAFVAASTRPPPRRRAGRGRRRHRLVVQRRRPARLRHARAHALTTASGTTARRAAVRHDLGVTAAPRARRHERRLLRLRHELDDDGIWLPADDDLRALLLAELDYARHPHAHEGVAPRYGALLATPDALRTRGRSNGSRSSTSAPSR